LHGDLLSDVIARVDAHLASFLDRRELPRNLDEAIRYSLLGGGKRIRPALAWFSAIACGAPGEDSLTAGAAVELIHAFSLIHDDLPALDNDDVRRGRPTLHKHAGEAMAILAGDALLSLAYESTHEHPEPSIALRLGAELAHGTRSMIAGQIYDTIGGFSKGLSDADAVEQIHRNKTGALLRASCRMGAITGKANDETLGYVTRYSEAIGLQFQIIDDLLDVEGSTEAVGKKLGKDYAAGKRTYPGAIGIKEAREVANQLGKEADRALSGLESLGLGDTEPLRQIGVLLTHRRA
jgi:geranylgeranyl diphosphate synthase type II